MCDGHQLEVFGVGAPIYRLSTAATPIKLYGKLLLEHAAARVLVRDLTKVQRRGSGAEAEKSSAQGLEI